MGNCYTSNGYVLLQVPPTPAVYGDGEGEEGGSYFLMPSFSIIALYLLISFFIK